MASQTTPTYDSQNRGFASGFAGDEVKATDANGRQRILFAKYTTTSVVTTGTDRIALFKLPAGARIISLEMFCPNTVTTSNAKMGNASNSTLYGSGVDISLAGAGGRSQFITSAAAIDTNPATDGGHPSTKEETVYFAPVVTSFGSPITFAVLCQYVVD